MPPFSFSPPSSISQSSKGKLRSLTLPLAMVLRIQHTGQRSPQAFAVIHPTPQEFYIREPLDAELRLNKTYHFHVQSLLDTRHHKLSMRAPSTKEYNFIYFPADGCYLLDLECREVGPWNLVYTNAKEGKRTVATYQCVEGPLV